MGYVYLFNKMWAQNRRVFQIPGHQQMYNNIFFIEVLHLVTLNFYNKFDGLFSIFTFDLALWIKHTYLNTKILMWEVELFIFDIDF